MPDPGTLRLDGVKQKRCTICNGSHSEKHRPYECKGWHNVSLQSEGEVRSCEQQARNSTNEWLWERGGASFPGACLIDREADGSKLGLISATGSRMIPQVEGVIPGFYCRKIAIDWFLRGCHWEVCCVWLGSGADGSRCRSEAWKHVSELRGAEDH